MQRLLPKTINYLLFDGRIALKVNIQSFIFIFPRFRPLITLQFHMVCARREVICCVSLQYYYDYTQQVKFTSHYTT